MGRFIAIVIVLVVLALGFNALTNNDSAEVVDRGDATESDPAAAESSDSDSATGEAPESVSEESPADADSTAAESASTEAESSDEAIVAQKDAETETETAVGDQAEQPPTQQPMEDVGEEEVELLTADLTSGIEGDGPLTIEEIQAWLGDSRNHMVLKPVLPKGLAAGANQITGIEETPLTRARIELGRQIYFDTRISVDNSISCASCHDPENGYAKDTKFGIGVEDQEGGRNSPTAYNRLLSKEQFWDGRAATLEDQAIGPMANPIEMGSTHDVVVETLGGIEGYRIQFEKVFEDGLTIENAGRALASFERVIVTGPTPWDYYVELRDFKRVYEADLEDLEYLQEDDPLLYEDYMALQEASDAHPLGEEARRGGELFFSDKAGCTQCHVGANFTDELYHNLGVGMSADEPDLGRYEVTQEDKDRGAFKTPTVRNVSQTAPYMHDGSVETLQEVVELYVDGGEPNEYLSDKITKLELTDQDQADLVAFMESLTGELPAVETGRLPAEQ